jgi:hypothetical protein
LNLVPTTHRRLVVVLNRIRLAFDVATHYFFSDAFVELIIGFAVGPRDLKHLALKTYSSPSHPHKIVYDAFVKQAYDWTVQKQSAIRADLRAQNTDFLVEALRAQPAPSGPALRAAVEFEIFLTSLAIDCFNHNFYHHQFLAASYLAETIIRDLVKVDQDRCGKELFHGLCFRHRRYFVRDADNALTVQDNGIHMFWIRNHCQNTNIAYIPFLSKCVTGNTFQQCVALRHAANHFD